MTMQDPKTPKTKVFDYSQYIDAPVETVWRAISEGDELKKWFPVDARIKPGIGGSIFLSWGPACEGEAPLVMWEPGQALGWTEQHDNGAVQIAAEFRIATDPERGGTILRVVQSGFGQGQKWDDMYDSISNGWKFELKSLNHYLTRHRGKSRSPEWIPVPMPVPSDRAWSLIAASDGRGVLRQGSLSGYREGDQYAFTGPDDGAYSGRVLRSIDHKTFSGTVHELDDAILRIEVERSGTTSMVCVWLSIWGPRAPETAPIAKRWADRITTLSRTIETSRTVNNSLS